MNDFEKAQAIANELSKNMDLSESGLSVCPMVQQAGDYTYTCVTVGDLLVWDTEDCHPTGEWPDRPEGLDDENDDDYDRLHSVEMSVRFARDQIRYFIEALQALLVE